MAHARLRCPDGGHSGAVPGCLRRLTPVPVRGPSSWGTYDRTGADDHVADSTHDGATACDDNAADSAHDASAAGNDLDDAQHCDHAAGAVGTAR